MQTSWFMPSWYLLWKRSMYINHRRWSKMPQIQWLPHQRFIYWRWLWPSYDIARVYCLQTNVRGNSRVCGLCIQHTEQCMSKEDYKYICHASWRCLLGWNQTLMILSMHMKYQGLYIDVFYSTWWLIFAAVSKVFCLLYWFYVRRVALRRVRAFFVRDEVIGVTCCDQSSNLKPSIGNYETFP